MHGSYLSSFKSRLSYGEPSWGETNDSYLSSFKSRLSYNGYYPSLPSWRRGFDSLQPLQFNAHRQVGFFLPAEGGRTS